MTCARSKDLLQGTYAHLAVTELLAYPAGVTTDADAEAAAERFAYWTRHTRDAIETLTNSGSLTPLGVRFAFQMRQSAQLLTKLCIGARIRRPPAGGTVRAYEVVICQRQ